MKTRLARIAQMSKENPDMVFTSIGHLIDVEMLSQCHAKMDSDKAVGIDGVTKEEYGEKLEDNLTNLVSRLKDKSYKPQPARRVEIPKDNGKTRPLSIYCYEDKLVQEAIKEVLEAVFEPHFYGEMMGFRPNRNCHQALKKLNRMIEWEKTNYVLDADIKGFFDHIDHEWAVKFIESKIKDPNVIRLIRRMLKAGIMKDFHYEETEAGSGQGSVCSPTIANIYMHYVLLWWFHEIVQPSLKGFSGVVVYADDFVCCFQYKEEAEQFYERLKHRMGYFGLQLEESKSRLIEFGRFAASSRKRRHERKPETFTFLGFTHYIGTTASIEVRYKGQEYVIRAIAELKKKGIQFDYELVGAGKSDYLHSVAVNCGVENQVHFLGVKLHEEIPDWLDHLDFYAQPSKQEGLPRALIEALSRGCPSIGSITAGIPELLQDDVIFKNGDVNGICRILENLISEDLEDRCKSNFEKAKMFDLSILNIKRGMYYSKYLEETLRGRNVNYR